MTTIAPYSSANFAASQWPPHSLPEQARTAGFAVGEQADARQASTPKGRETGSGLTPEQQAEVEKLQKTDQEVRQHEMAHLAAGAGMITSGASYTYTRGPDGQNYAVAGEVSIDTSPGRTPEETIARAERIQAAAMAPADPSPQDRRVAAEAAQMAAEARQEMAAAQDSAQNPAMAAYQAQAREAENASLAQAANVTRINLYA